jgi:hypothetical protein
VASDSVGGARCWYQEADLSFEVDRTVEVGDLELMSGRARARSGSVNWLDPVIGARIRYSPAAGHEFSAQ